MDCSKPGHAPLHSLTERDTKLVLFLPLHDSGWYNKQAASVLSQSATQCTHNLETIVLYIYIADGSFFAELELELELEELLASRVLAKERMGSSEEVVLDGVF